MNLVNIVTENGWVVRPDISKELKEKKAGRIFRDNILPRSQEAANILDSCWSFKMLPGVMTSEDVKDGHLAVIKAPAYQMGQNTYDLEGYGIPCVITKYRGLFPLFRQAHMAERFIYVDDELKEDWKGNKEIIQACLIHTWPQIVELKAESLKETEVRFTLF